MFQFINLHADTILKTSALLPTLKVSCFITAIVYLLLLFLCGLFLCFLVSWLVTQGMKSLHSQIIISVTQLSYKN